MQSQKIDIQDLEIFNIYFPPKSEPVNPHKNCKFVVRQGGFNPETHEGLSIHQILELDSVKWYSNRLNFYGFFTTGHNKSENSPLNLMALSNWSDEFNGCMDWYVVGYLHGYIQALTGLKMYGSFKASHKPNCWIRKYNSCEDLIDTLHFPEKAMKVAKELGWERSDFMGIANTCTCGFETAKRK